MPLGNLYHSLSIYRMLCKIRKGEKTKKINDLDAIQEISEIAVGLFEDCKMQEYA